MGERVFSGRKKLRKKDMLAMEPVCSIFIVSASLFKKRKVSVLQGQ